MESSIHRASDRNEASAAPDRLRALVDAGIALPWYRWIGDAGRAVSIEHFGASAPGELLFKEYGIDAEHVAAAAKESIKAARS